MLQSLADGLLSESPPPGGRSGLLVNLGTNCLVDAQVLPDLAIGGQMTRTMQLTQRAVKS
ncbi:hypothetical protein [Fibrella forsythiae]|uniref:Uncharacterized protein n=1 Tax=Fibrella forsythiae TaxID=2817061 RepID=A0ABS3JSH8_9BACT|nr:hypothetical protein [Fibrella forsythiae]MBO0952970.1 hypothetical protein [Fibrella forsythiae]